MEFVTGADPLRKRPGSRHRTVKREPGCSRPPSASAKSNSRWFHGSWGSDPDRSPAASAHPARPALANSRAETHRHGRRRGTILRNGGGPGDRQMVALWHEDGYALELRAWVPDLAAFEERLGWLSRVDSQTWLDAMPAKVVKAADHDAAVREMLKGIPVPSGFKPVTDSRRRPDHQSLPSGRLRDRHRLLPLVPAVGRGPQDRRQRGRGRSREGDGDRQALADPA